MIVDLRTRVTGRLPRLELLTIPPFRQAFFLRRREIADASFVLGLGSIRPTDASLVPLFRARKDQFRRFFRDVPMGEMSDIFNPFKVGIGK